MRQLIALLAVLGAWLTRPPVETKQIRTVDRPDGQPPIEVRVCP